MNTLSPIADTPIADTPRTRVAALLDEVSATLVGHGWLVERLLIASLAGGHVLLEGPPGVAKTRAVKQLAARLPGTHARIQCTPDLLPSDLTGSQVWRGESGAFDFIPGPIFHNIVLVDEINRAPPKVQSALLEAMAEAQVTTGGVTRPLPRPFMVVATQNPIEHEGTFALPEAQLDRFLLHLRIDMPDAAAERAILDLVEAETRAEPVARGLRAVDAASLSQARAEVAAVQLAPVLKDFIVRLVMATRPGGGLAQAVAHPVSPRGTLALAGAVRARAWLHGRDHGLPEDVEALACDALGHRLVADWTAMGQGRDGRALIAEALGAVRPW